MTVWWLSERRLRTVRSLTIPSLRRWADSATGSTDCRIGVSCTQRRTNFLRGRFCTTFQVFRIKNAEGLFQSWAMSTKGSDGSKTFRPHVHKIGVRLAADRILRRCLRAQRDIYRIIWPMGVASRRYPIGPSTKCRRDIYARATFRRGSSNRDGRMGVDRYGSRSAHSLEIST